MIETIGAFFAMYQPWLRAFHIMAVIAWMAGLFYLPRLYVYHAMEQDKQETCETFKIMEEKLLRIIMWPALMASWVSGIMLYWANWEYYMSAGWMHIKLLAIILMTITHVLYAEWYKDFEKDENKRSHVFYRVWNEVPTLLMIIIIIMAVIEPF